MMGMAEGMGAAVTAGRRGAWQGRRSSWRVRWLALGSVAVLPSMAMADVARPLWELGAGVGAVRVPDYPGAARRSNYVIPTPVVVFRGQYLRSDREGVRGVLLDTDRVELDLSAGLTPAARSADNPRRVGMDNLRPTVELGPKLIYAAWRGDGGRLRWDGQLPLRASFTMERASRLAGLVLAPETRFTFRDVARVSQLDVTLHATGEWADHRYLRRTLGVETGDATSARTAFYPSGGYAGSQVGARVERRIGPAYIGMGVTRHFLQGAEVARSPLVETRATTLHWVFVSWMLAHSDERARDGDAR